MSPAIMEMLCGGRTAGCEEVHCLGSAVTPPLKGRKRWPLTLLESAVLELNVVDSASDNMIGRTLKSTFKPHLQERWVIPPEANAAFVAAREDVWRSIRGRMIGTARWFALMRRQSNFIKRTRVPLRAKPGQPARHDNEHERKGTANLVILFASLEGWRYVELTDRHATLDYAQILKALSDEHPQHKQDRAGAGQSEHSNATIALRGRLVS